MRRPTLLCVLLTLFAAPAFAAEPATHGAWTLIVEGQEPAVNMALLADGRHVVYYSGFEYTSHDDPALDVQLVTGAHPHSGSTRVLDLDTLDHAAPSITTPTNPDSDGDLFCSAHLVRADGTFVAFGGSEYAAAHTDPLGWDVILGLKTMHVFDTVAGWGTGPDMNHGRWYPTAVNLPDGSTLVASGIEVLGDTTTQQSAIEVLDPDGATWTVIGETEHLPLYPTLFVVTAGPHEGDVLYAGLGQTWAPLGYWYDPLFNHQKVIDPDAGAITELGPTLLPIRDLGFCALAPLSSPSYETTVMCGGGAVEMAPVATNLVEATTLTPEGAVERGLVDPMIWPRWFPVAVQLADGRSLFVVGGTADNPNTFGGQTGTSKYPVMVPEVYDWVDGTWTELAEMPVGRQYHASAILLPDGRVLVGGTVSHASLSETMRESVDLVEQIVERRLTVYEPPYLHRGDRPEITSAVASIGYGETVQLTVTSETDVSSVHLVRPGNSTHTLDTEQRIVHLEYTATRRGSSEVVHVDVTGPPRRAVAPPGTYMLFVTRDTAEGPVPSVAAMVTIGL